MSLRTGNNFFRQGCYDKAIVEYKKLVNCDVLGEQAKFNIHLALRRKGVGATTKLEYTPVSKDASRPLLSIVMPVFNVAPYLDASILSVLNQGFSDFELIIVNDASTDNSSKIIDMHASQDERVKAIHLSFNTLGGAGTPSNIGIKKARGKYIGFVDSDDWITPNALAELVASAESNSADIVIGDFCTFHDDDRTVAKSYDSANWSGIPIGKVVSVREYPQIFRTSPVPWRKLYRADFLKKNGITFPEGDYFYEDNPLHWFVVSQAEKVVFSNKVISYHRMVREGQTMAASPYKLSAMSSHLNTIASKVICQSGNPDEIVAKEFYDYWYRCDWIAAKQPEEKVAKLIRKQMGNIYLRCKEVATPISDRVNFENRVNTCLSAYQDIDLTVVIPSYNCEEFLQSTVESVLSIKKITINVIIIDDGSNDNTLSVAKSLESKDKRIFVFQQNNRGAGRARNSVIPLCVGEYTYFLDADDYVYSDGLEKAVRSAMKYDNDLMFFKYRIEYFEEQKSRGMFNADADLWEKLKSCFNNREKQKVVSGLINYPWNRIIKTSLLLNENIFFGGSVVHNDIPYHWHTISAAKNIGHIDDEVCVHRKFENRQQITNISDVRRMMVFSSLEYTHEKLSKYDLYSEIKPVWKKFSTELLKWAKERVPVSCAEEFLDNQAKYLSKFN